MTGSSQPDIRASLAAAVHAGIGAGGGLGFCAVGDIVAVSGQQHPPDVGTVVAQQALFCNGVVVADLPFQQVCHVPQVGGLGKVPDVLHVQQAAVGAGVLLHGLVQQGHLVQHHAVLLDAADVGVVVRDAHPGVVLPAALGDDDVKHMPLLGVLDGDGHRLQIVPDGRLLFLADLRDDLQLLLGGTGDDACRHRRLHALQVPGVGHDDAFHVLDDAAAHLQLHAVRQHPQHLAGFCRRIGQRDGLGAAHRRDQLLLQDLHISLIARVVAFHNILLPSLLEIGSYFKNSII